MYGQVEPAGRTRATSGRHRDRSRTPFPAALGIAVFALLAAFGLGAALLPQSLTGSGTAAEPPAAGPLAPGAGGGVPGARASTSPAPATSSPAVRTGPPSRAPASRTPTARAGPPKPTPARTSSKPSPPAAPGLAGQENEVIRLTNAERDRAGCRPLELDTKLRTAMRLHVEELARRGDLYISHVSADGRSFVDRAREQGYDAAGGENLARGQHDAADVTDGWMNSAGHRANILNCGFRAIGVGAVKGVDGTIVWGQIFGRE